MEICFKTVLLLDKQTTEKVTSFFCASSSRLQNVSHLLQGSKDKTFYVWKTPSVNRSQCSNNRKIILHRSLRLAKTQRLWSELTLQEAYGNSLNPVRPADKASWGEQTNARNKPRPRSQLAMALFPKAAHTSSGWTHVYT